MKTYKVLLISTLAFALLIGGIFTLQTQASVIQADVRCTPFVLSLDDPTPAEFRITIGLPKPYTPEDIDGSTILVGGLVGMKPVPDWPKITKKFFAFKINGVELMDWVIWPHIWHITPPPQPKTWVDIDITVTGELYSGEAFQGTFTMRVRTENPENPEPPPPP
jgi:hypothetical protein